MHMLAVLCSTPTVPRRTASRPWRTDTCCPSPLRPVFPAALTRSVSPAVSSHSSPFPPFPRPAPQGQRLTRMASTPIARMYHSVAALTTDGTVVVAGCDRCFKFKVEDGVPFSPSPTSKAEVGHGLGLVAAGWGHGKDAGSLAPPRATPKQLQLKCAYARPVSAAMARRKSWYTTHLPTVPH